MLLAGGAALRPLRPRPGEHAVGVVDGRRRRTRREAEPVDQRLRVRRVGEGGVLHAGDVEGVLPRLQVGRGVDHRNHVPVDGGGAVVMSVHVGGNATVMRSVSSTRISNRWAVN